MKHSIFVNSLLILSLALIVGACNKKKNGGPDPDELRIEALAGDYKSASSKTWSTTSVTFNGTENRTIDWANFTLTISTDGSGEITYTATNAVADGPWPAAGSFTFDQINGEPNINKLIRDDSMEITIALAGNDVTMTFIFDNMTHTSGRTESINGEYIFVLTSN